jgi:hypothetical protein
MAQCPPELSRRDGRAQRCRRSNSPTEAPTEAPTEPPTEAPTAGRTWLEVHKYTTACVCCELPDQGIMVANAHRNYMGRQHEC